MSGVDDVQTTLPTAGESMRKIRPLARRASVSCGALALATPGPRDEQRAALREVLQMLGLAPSPPPAKEHRKPWH